MKTWEKTLHAVQQLPEAIAEANKWNQEWKEWGRNTAEARMTRSVTTHKPHYELHTRKESVVVPGRKEFKTDAGKYLPDLFKEGRVFMVASPEYLARHKGKVYFGTNKESIYKQCGSDKVDIRHIKGWGEISAEDMQPQPICT